MNFQRQLDIFDPSKHDSTVTIIGAGTIGSSTALMLTKLGMQKIMLVDDDKVEEHNLPNQFFKAADVGRLKVEALRDMCLEFMPGAKIEAVPERLTEDSTIGLYSVVISAVDSMASRAAIWEHVRLNPAVTHFVDARMGGENFRVFGINPVNKDDVELFESTLHSDDEGVELPCTARSIIYNGFAIGSVVASNVKKFFVDEDEHFKEIAFDLNGLEAMKWR